MSFLDIAMAPRRPEPGTPVGAAAYRLLEPVFDACPDGVLIVAPDQTVQLMNAAAESLFDLRRDKVRGAKLETLRRLARIGTDELWTAVAGQKQWDGLWKSDSGRSILFSVRRMRDTEHAVVGTLVVQRDLDVIGHVASRSTGEGPAARRFRFREGGPGGPGGGPDFTGQRQLSPLLDRVLSRGQRAVERSVGLLLTGESGVGKTELARWLHARSAGSNRPFVHVNCAGIPDTLFESEMFGYEQGTFTGALRGGKAGHIEAAHGGTLFLDEIGEIPLAAQAKLLTFLEERRVQRIGSSQARSVDVRVICATNRDLAEMVEAGRFRRDLYYRIAVVVLEVAPLRRQPALIEPLVETALARVNARRGEPLSLSAEALERLRAYDFPGNVRELFNIVEQASVNSDGAVAGLDDLPPALLGREPETPAETLEGYEDLSLRQAVKRFERQLIDRAIARHGSKRKAAEALAADIGTIVRKSRD